MNQNNFNNFNQLNAQGVPTMMNQPAFFSGQLGQTQGAPMQMQQLQQQQQQQHMGMQFAWPGWSPMMNGQQWAQPPPQGAMAQMPRFAQGPSQTSVVDITAAIAAAVRPILQENRSTPAGSDPEDERTLIAALRRGRAEGLTTRQAIEKLHNVNNHTAASWKDFYLDHDRKIFPKVYGLSASSTSSVSHRDGRADLARPGQRSYSSGYHRSTDSQANSSRSLSSKKKNAELLDKALAQAKKRRCVEEQSESESSSEEEENAEEEEGTEDEDNDQSSEDEANAGGTSRAAPSTRGRRGRTTHGIRVTEDDLRAMAKYKAERLHRWSDYPSKQGAWKEFSERPGNEKRTVNAWTCAARDHASKLEFYLQQYLADEQASESGAESTPPQQDDSRTSSRASSRASSQQTETEETTSRKRPAESSTRSDSINSESAAKRAKHDELAGLTQADSEEDEDDIVEVPQP
ncbi:hypothetical protein K466DRAFT_659461 [Polyporus arcularius HHB13444]|uniref:Uncharacterized protein n=1 Tax=Polyporus arcularius HHB13444 TaxID=1314778 RepID=A0A5C3PSP1_9APHY|nr:hypothetical protein K466DRAFT_659461 [Polyporus arcularius HHB13444]